jgi:hypothetical protein
MRPSTVVGRAALMLVALVLAAWFALGTRQAHGTSRATAALAGRGPLSAKEFVHVTALLDGASTLNPDRQVDVLHAQAVGRHGNPRQAEQLLHRVVGDEPQNLQAWIAMLPFVPNPAAGRAVIGHVQTLIGFGSHRPRNR